MFRPDFLASVSFESQQRNLGAENFSYYVAKSNSNIVGVIALRDKSHLFHLFVSKEFQGQRLASKLWNAVKTEALEAGNPGEFTVNSSLNAIQIYEAFGFTREGDVKRMHGVAFQPMRLSCTNWISQRM
ncbi:MAG: GNAT family N-acetyltransferase [Paucibacter sp.]|nr:GNAT family N-acetyltransferase [Roseateles sp.]